MATEMTPEQRRSILAAYQNGEVPEKQWKALVDAGYFKDSDKYRLAKPADLPYASAYDPKTMSIGDWFKSQLEGQKGFSQFSEEALRQGPSAWATMALDQSRADELNARSDADATASGRAADARSALAARGGASAGAIERLMKDATKQSLFASQGTAAAGAKNRSNILMDDEKNRVQMLGQLPGMEMGRLEAESGAKKFDLANLIAEGGRKNEFDLMKWNKNMEQWGAGQTAAAQQDAGCWLISRITRETGLKSGQAEDLTRFKRAMSKFRPDLAMFYIRRCRPLVRKMDEAGFAWAGLRWFNDAVMSLIRAGEFTSAFNLWQSVVLDLVDSHWPDCPHELVVRARAERARSRARWEEEAREANPSIDPRFMGSCAKTLEAR